MIGYGVLEAGERVLVHSAGGGVGIAATQIAKKMGAEVYGTASPSKHQRILELGVDRALDYTKDGWERGIGQFDVILDAVGGKSFRTSYSLLRPGGRLVAFGASSVVSGEKKSIPTALKAVLRMPRFNLIKQMSESKTVIGLNMLTLWKDRGTLGPWIDPLSGMLTDGTIEPVVAGVFSFEEAGAAQTMIVERRNIGKVVLTPAASRVGESLRDRRLDPLEGSSLLGPARPAGSLTRVVFGSRGRTARRCRKEGRSRQKAILGTAAT